MSIYDLFSVNEFTHPYDVESAGKTALRNLNVGNLKRFLQYKNLSFTDEEVKKLLQNMKLHVSASASILLDPGLKDCYDAWLQSLNSSEKQNIVRARLTYMNAHKCQVMFGKGCFDSLSNNDSIYVPKLPLNNNGSKSQHLNCRWCKKNFSLTDFVTLQCKCTARVGHTSCANAFSNEYSNRCPVCRGSLLKRTEISKYMFWGIENKFKL